VNEIILITRAWNFAAARHSGQRRKGQAQEPYINHLSEVAELVAFATAGSDANLVAAAILHDTVEDTPTLSAELVKAFNEDVASLVAEVTDDKNHLKRVRKRHQVVSAPGKSSRAKLLKLADKTSNLRSLAKSPPTDWSVRRRREYLKWALAVAAGLRGENLWLEAQFDEAVKQSEQALGLAGSRRYPHRTHRTPDGRLKP
jgi:(p)ppGpp synthase/HD superfamily hydrolase